MSFPKLILITSEQVNELQIQCILQSLNDIDKLHIKINADKTELFALLNKMIPLIDKQNLNKIVIHLNHRYSNNNRPSQSLEELILYISQTFEVSNFHLSEKIFTDYFQLLSPALFHQFNFSLSLHHLNLKEVHNHFTYILYGPVFPGISKKNYYPEKDFIDLKKDLQIISDSIEIPIMAVGGITNENFENIIQSGFSGIAIRGSIWEEQEPIVKLKSFSKKWTTFKSQLS